ncbi:MAG: DUF6624 domain-containing protein [Bacteriovorax sp.]|jgi:hypothetical protein
MKFFVLLSFILAYVSLFAANAANDQYPHIDAKIIGYDEHIAELRKTYSTFPEDHNNKDWVKSEITYMAMADHYSVNFASIVFPDYIDPNSPEVVYYMQVFQPRLQQLLVSNSEMMKELLKTYKWITISEFGKDYDIAAWVLVQHADFDRPFQKQVLSILEELYKINETSKANYAYMYDRLSRADGKLQRYGTQGECRGPMNWQPFESEDQANLDQRRSDMEMDSLAKEIEINNPRCGK